MRNVIVTGAAGMIGANLCHHLMDLDFCVVGVDDLSGGNVDFAPTTDPRFTFLPDDVLSPRFEEAVAHYRPNAIFHLSAYAAECLSPWIRQHNARNNYEATTRVVSLALKYDVKHVTYTSSAAVYGHTEGLAHEGQAAPADPYGITKLASEMDIKEAHKRFGLGYTIFRPHNVYGRFQNLWDRYRNVIGIFMRQALAGEPMSVYGDGSQIRQFTSVHDVVRIMAESVTNPDFHNETFNIGSGKSTTVLDLAHFLCDHTKHHTVQHLEARDEAHVVETDHTKLTQMTGRTCDITLEDGLRDMWEWAKTAPHWEPKFPPAEHRTGLYSYWSEA